MRIFHGIIVFGLIWTTSATPLTFGKFYGDKGKAPTRHPVILVPGDGGSKMMAKLNKTSGPHYWCYQHTSFYLLWLNLDVLFSKFMDCFASPEFLADEPLALPSEEASAPPNTRLSHHSLPGNPSEDGGGTGSESDGRPLGLTGLRNTGNTCFLNTVVQCLSNTRALHDYILRDGRSSDASMPAAATKGSLMNTFSALIRDMWTSSDETERVLTTAPLKSMIQRLAPRFMGSQQQDAQEFLRYLLQGLHEDVNRVTSRPKPITTDIDDSLSASQKSMEAWKRFLRLENSKFVDLFVGQLKATLRCTVCGHASVTFDPFWDLSLPIPSRSGQVRLQACFDLFTKEEVLDGDEKPTCSKCQKRQKCTRSLSIQKFPRILVVHLKRFSPQERFRGKLNTTVDFSVNGLDLSPYSAGQTPCRYSLYGVANHSGTLLSGHYTAHCRHPYTAEWYEYNDSRVHVMDQRNVNSGKAYVLFFELAGSKYRSGSTHVDNMKLTYNITDRKTYNTPGVETVVPGFGTTDTIENLSDWNSIFFSYTQYFYHIVENMVTQLNYTRNVDVVGAPYDFRKAPNELGVFLANLTRLTEQVYYRNANRRVVLVTHSYGCPLTLHWLHSRPQAWKDKFIEQWVSLAGPFAGTALSYEVYAAGYNLNVWELSGSRLRQEQRTSPSLAFLSPSPQAWPKDYVFLSTPETNYTLQNVQQFFTDINYTVGWEMRKDTAGLLDITQPPGVSMYCVYGNGSATTERVVYTDMAKFPDTPDHVVKGAGDGTVNLRSLQWCESWRGRQRQPLVSRLYPDADHMGMITKPAMAAEIVNHLAALNGGQLV
ncbi:Ubiquitin carboxyl-terminal hydrolase 2 [Amphibalanus amphitrite]|uniref:ubiquitinyl hydrolase 1 n=1 Tax=Amphibalanus amphitrite TaxID=1232801 RepID=A0A6A4WJ91_AMPAM|nr:Ubiquitin carboxyl-terminal hydrolase 2 [Amphibalanus amphitrite]